MVRALLSNQRVNRQWTTSRLQPFLQTGLGILEFIDVGHAVDQGVDEGQYDLAAGVQSAVQVHGAQQGLEGVGENGGAAEAAGFKLPFSQSYLPAQVDMACQLGQGAAPHEPGPHAAEVPFAGVRVTLEQAGRHHHVQHAVSEKLETFVI